jgi:mRNA interferase MazF
MMQMNQKDFDAWNENKKLIHAGNENKLYHSRDIWWCSLGVNIGFEEDGTGNTGERPVVIIRGFSKQVCLVMPLTSSEKKNPYHISLGIVDNRKAFVITSQIRLIDTKRLINKIGVVNQKLFEEIRKAAKNLF